jgi:uncharacterized protein
MAHTPLRGPLLRVTVDTNLFVSATIRRGSPFQLLLAWRNGLFLLVLSESLVREIGTVLRRPFFAERYGVTEAQIRRLERRYERAAHIVPDEALRDLPAGVEVRDYKDRHVLQAALSGRADYLVTGDDDLLSLSDHQSLRSLRIVRVGQLLSAIGWESGQGRP